MTIKHLFLQNFRNHTKSTFTFSDGVSVIVGPNVAGKTNLIEALYILATGKSFRTEKDKQLIQFGKPVARVKGLIASEYGEDTDLEVVISESPTGFMQKKYLVNGVSKRRVDFSGRIPAVLFTPTDIDTIAGQPSYRRKFLDDVLEQVSLDYRLALATYSKGLRQRNALLEHVQQSGIRNEKLFMYWDELLIANGQIIAQKREEFIQFINDREKEIFPFTLVYDKSVISEERLLQYKQAEVGAGVTLVGPHRDDVIAQAFHKESKQLEDVKYFSSRGQQRLILLELKLSQISYVQEHLETQPLLLLDDIFSELDKTHITLVMDKVASQQVIITTTHVEFLSYQHLLKPHVIELKSL